MVPTGMNYSLNTTQDDMTEIQNVFIKTSTMSSSLKNLFIACSSWQDDLSYLNISLSAISGNKWNLFKFIYFFNAQYSIDVLSSFLHYCFLCSFKQLDYCNVILQSSLYILNSFLYQPVYRHTFLHENVVQFCFPH